MFGGSRRRSDARAEALLGEIRDLSRKIDREHELNRRQYTLSEERYKDQLQITREVVRRNELAFRDGAEVLAELVAEVRAMREGVFALIDELRGGGASPAT